MNRGLLTLIADSQGVQVIFTHGTRRTQSHVKNPRRADILKAVKSLVIEPRALRGIIVGFYGLSFSGTRSLIVTANALAFAASCPVVRIPSKDLHDIRLVLEVGNKLLQDQPQKWLAPQYESAPNITRAHTGVRFHENAGGIVYDAKQNAFLFVQRKDTGVIGTPKGHHMEGEKLVDTAIREISEETGITGLSFIARLPSVKYLADDHGKLPKKIPHHLHHFLFVRVSRKVIPRVITGEVANLRIIWWPADSKAPPKKMHRDLRPVHAQALAILKARKLINVQTAKKHQLRRNSSR